METSLTYLLVGAGIAMVVFMACVGRMLARRDERNGLVPMLIGVPGCYVLCCAMTLHITVLYVVGALLLAASYAVQFRGYRARRRNGLTTRPTDDWADDGPAGPRWR